jgi:acyl-CoA synthetase (AMP-forming)/AMP-acid ligase II
MQLNNNTKYPTLDSLVSSRAKELPEHRFLLHPLYNTAETTAESITYGLFDTHLSCLAHAWASMGRDNAPLIAPKTVVGVFLPSGYTLCVAMFALIRLGAVPFCLSPRNSDEGLKHLLRTEKITTIVTTSIDGVLPRLETILAADTSFDISLLDVSEVSRNDSDTVVSYPSLPEGIIKPVDTVIMQHVSGPK